MIPQHRYVRAPARPWGGSLWARFFAGPREITVQGWDCEWRDHVVVAPDGAVEDAPAGARAGDTAMWLPAGPGVCLGAFLGGPLGVVAGREACPALLGPPLTPVQGDVLERLALRTRFHGILAPQTLGRLGVLVPSPATGAPAGEAVLAMAARLRAPALPPTVPSAIALLNAGSRPGLRNMQSLRAWARARGMIVPAPDTEPFAQTVRRLGQATLVLLTDGADAPLLALCHPGTQVLEIAPEGWADGRIRGVCDAAKLDWHLHLAEPPGDTLLPEAPPGFGYDIPIAALAHTLAML